MLASLVEAAYEYAFPLHAVARTRYRAVQDPLNAERHAPNSLLHIRRLSDHRSHWITAPNNDTLYSNAWLDLSAGPVRVRVGAQPAGRYWSVALMDAFTNHIAVLGQRCDGVGPVEATIVGPQHRGAVPPGRVVQAPGDDVWLFARCLVEGPDDLAAAHAMQDRIAVTAAMPAAATGRVVPGEPTDPGNFLAVVNESLGINPPPASDRERLSAWAAIGLRPGATGVWQTLPAGVQQVWRERIGTAFDAIRSHGTRSRRHVQGWVTAAADIGNFGEQHALRASVALGGLGALEPVEAMYFVRYRDDDDAPLDGLQRYVLRVPAAGIQTDSFWSFTMYEATPDGQRRLVDNPIGRYSIGDRSAGLIRSADGSVDIRLQRDPPAGGAGTANWLPTPAGLFQVALRAYLPRPALRACSAALPTLVSLPSEPR